MTMLYFLKVVISILGLTCTIILNAFENPC